MGSKAFFKVIWWLFFDRCEFYGAFDFAEVFPETSLVHLRNLPPLQLPKSLPQVPSSKDHQIQGQYRGQFLRSGAILRNCGGEIGNL